jgi:hypothetical protein
MWVYFQKEVLKVFQQFDIAKYLLQTMFETANYMNHNASQMKMQSPSRRQRRREKIRLSRLSRKFFPTAAAEKIRLATNVL